MFRLNSVHVIVIDSNRISYRKMGYGNFAKHVVTAVVCNEAHCPNEQTKEYNGCTDFWRQAIKGSSSSRGTCFLHCILFLNSFLKSVVSRSAVVYCLFSFSKCQQFASSLPAVRQQFASSLPAVCQQFATSLPPVCYQFATSLPPVCHQFDVCHQFATSLLPVCHQFVTSLPPVCHKFATSLPSVCHKFVISLPLVCHQFATSLPSV